MEGIFDSISGSLKLQGLSQVKFMEDAISESIGCYDIFTIGYFLNKKDVYEKYPEAGETLSALIKILVDKGVAISQVLKGCYIVIIFNKDNNQLLIYNDLLSKHSLFYCYRETKLYFADNFYKLVTLVKKENVSLTLDMLAIKMLKSHDVLYDDLTFVNEIKFLKPFQYISFEDKLELKCFPIPEVNKTISMSDTIEKVERLFNKAVEQLNCYNTAHGFKTCSTLSGGMDSRTTFQYCEKQGYHNHFCYCYAESGSKDNTIASNIANDYVCPFFFSPIDNGHFIKNRDVLCDILGGQMWYAGSTGTYQSLSVYDTGKLGIINAGIGGGRNIW